MALSVTGRVTIDAPTTTPAKSILDVVPVKAANPHEMQGVQFESTAAWNSTRAIDLSAASCIATAAKTPDGYDFGEGDPFYVYSAVQCFVFDSTDYSAEALARLNAGEGHGVERYFWETLLPGRATDLTPTGGPVSPKIALGLLEEYLGANYAGVPILHAGKRLSVFVGSDQLLQFTLDEARTNGGSLFVNGGGYTSLIGPDGDTAADGTVWMYATGAIELIRSEPIVHEANNLSLNKTFAVAERGYVALVDGPVVAINVTLE